MALDVRTDCTASCFELPEWRGLLTRDPNRHVFATQEWNKAWWEEFSAGKELVILTMWRSGELAAIVPLYEKEEAGRKVLRFVGGIDLTDYLGPICAPADRGPVAEALVQWLATTDRPWDELDAHNLPVPFGFAELLVETTDRLGFAFTLDQEETSAVLALGDDWEIYLGGLDKKDRHELRRKRRRLGKELPGAGFRSSTPDSLERDVATFIAMHRGADGHKGHFMGPEIATFFERLVRSFEPSGSLRLDFLEVGDRAIASTFGFELGGTFYLYNSAYEPDAARLSPGLVLVSELVKDAIERGLRIFDFLRGPERYKYQLGAQSLPLNNVRVLNKVQ